MIILLAGEDSYRREERFKEIFSAYLEKHGHSSAESFGLDRLTDFFNFIRIGSMFSPIRLAVLSGLVFSDLKNEDRETFIHFVSQAADDKSIVILLVSSDIPTGDLGFLTEKARPCEFFEPLSGKELQSFLKKEAKKRNLNLKDSALFDLISAFGGELWGIVTEMDKLALSPQFVIEKEAFGELNTFTLINALKFGRNVDKKIIALELLFTKLKEDPAKIFNITAASAPKTMEPEEWFGLMADYDVAVKSGKMDYENALLDFALR